MAFFACLDYKISVLLGKVGPGAISCVAKNFTAFFVLLAVKMPETLGKVVLEAISSVAEELTACSVCWAADTKSGTLGTVGPGAHL